LSSGSGRGLTWKEGDIIILVERETRRYNNFKAGFEVKMGIKKQKGLSEVETVKIEKEEDKNAEVVVLHKTLFQKDKMSVWSWLKEFTTEWSETFITKKKKRNQTP
jgi:hypothetical protein